jgi:high-affinity nickel-transport protein
MTESLALPTGSRWSRMWGALNRQDRRSLAGMPGFIVLLHVLGFGVLIALVIPKHYDLGDTGIFGIGVGMLAYTLGMRHAFDADHIAAVDNTTRKLMADGGRRPLSVGFCSPWDTRRSCSGWPSCCPSA